MKSQNAELQIKVPLIVEWRRISPTQSQYDNVSRHAIVNWILYSMPAEVRPVAGLGQCKGVLTIIFLIDLCSENTE